VNEGNSSGQIVISGMGMVTSLGYTADDSFAAARAGLSRATELPIHNFCCDETWGNSPLIGHTITALSVGHVGASKILSLGNYALKNLFRNRAVSDSEWARTAIFLNLSDAFLLDIYASESADWDNYGEQGPPSVTWRRQCKSVVTRLFASFGRSPEIENQHLYFGGHTGIAPALADAIQALQLGESDVCIVGGIDSLIELHLLEAAANAGLLKSQAFPIGFSPGEAAGFILLERQTQAAYDDNDAAISLGCSPVIAKDQINRFSESPPDGRCLAQVIQEATTGCAEDVGLLIADLNGDIHRANDWGCALTRLQSCSGIAECPTLLTSTSFGEVGAATGILSIGVAAWGRKRGYSPDGSTLIWLASDSGEKVALTLH
jgi:3-oxoacyl-[acyl-carrier-protein] synthase-1